MALRALVAALVVGLLLAPGGVAAHDWLRTMVLEATQGDLSMRGEAVLWTAQGPVRLNLGVIDVINYVKEAVNDPDAVLGDVGQLVATPRAGFGDATLAAALGQADCATLNYVFFYDPWLSTGRAHVNQLGPGIAPLCGGAHGEAGLLQVSYDPGVYFGGGCSRATVWANVPPAPPGATLCDYVPGSATGNGVFLQVWFFWVIDIFLANEGAFS